MQCAGMAVAPRVSCCRRIDDATLARAVNDRDNLANLSGSTDFDEIIEIIIKIIENNMQ